MSLGSKSLPFLLLIAGTVSLSSLAQAQRIHATSNSGTSKKAIPPKPLRSGSKLPKSVANSTAHAASEPAPKATAATKDLGGTATSPKNSKGVPVRKVSAHTDAMNKQTAKAVNKIPGINIQAADLQPPAPDPPIKGFHPIKKLMRPVIRLGKGAVQIQQSMMKLEGPIAGLQPSMTSLGTKMSNVNSKMTHMQSQLSGMKSSVVQINSGLDKVGSRLDEIRGDIGGMTQQVAHLTVPVKQIQAPLHELLEPLKDVQKPMGEVKGQLGELHSMLQWVLVAIIVAVLAITIGTPLAAVQVYRNRKKLFPHLLNQHEDTEMHADVEKTLSAV